VTLTAKAGTVSGLLQRLGCPFCYLIKPIYKFKTFSKAHIKKERLAALFFSSE
jgi:hypothetical protein